MRLEERLPLLLAIVRKDLHAALMGILVTSAIAGAFVLLTVSAAANARSFGTFVWNDLSLRGFYATITALTSIGLGVAFYSVHGGEIQKGTIRSVMLYPVDMNDLSVAKLLSALLLAFLFTVILFFGFFGAFFAFGVFPILDFLAVYATTLLLGFLALATGVFLSHVLAAYAGRLVLSPAALGGLFLFLAILLTETAATAIGDFFLILGAQARGTLPSPADFLAVQEAARAISVLSPHHMGGRLLALAFGISAMWPDPHVVLPVFALVVVGGLTLGRKIYLDVFLR